jgi:hypothetical protein
LGENAVYTKANTVKISRSAGLESSAAQIQPASDGEKRHEKTDGAKDENGFENLTVNRCS